MKNDSVCQAKNPWLNAYSCKGMFLSWLSPDFAWLPPCTPAPESQAIVFVSRIGVRVFLFEGLNGITLVFLTISTGFRL